MAERPGGVARLLAASLALAAALGLAPAAASAADLGRAVLDEINFARAHPAQYARELDQDRDPDDGYAPVDPEDLDEAIAFLDRQRPLPPLAPSAALARSAEAYAAAQGPRGLIGHTGLDGSGPSQRINRQGVRWPLTAETISYGYGSAAGVVRQLIVDSGVADRGHRRILFDPDLEIAGAGCGAHAVYRHVCVIDFAGTPRGLRR